MGRQAPSSSLQASAGGGAAGVGEDDGWRPAHLAARALPPREVVYLLGTFVSLLCRSLGDVEQLVQRDPTVVILMGILKRLV